MLHLPSPSIALILSKSIHPRPTSYTARVKQISNHFRAASYAWSSLHAKRVMSSEAKGLRGSSGEKTLVIVESPAKAKTIQNFLKDISDDYIVDFSAGHVREIAAARDMPKDFVSAVVQPGLRIRTADLGVDVFNDFTPIYSTIKGKQEVIQRLKEKAKNVDRILLATDEDREGEAISWHLVDILKPKVPYQVSPIHVTYLTYFPQFCF